MPFSVNRANIELIIVKIFSVFYLRISIFCLLIPSDARAGIHFIQLPDTFKQIRSVVD